MAALMTQPAEGGGFTRALDRSFSARWPFRADDLTELLGDVRAPVLVVRAAESEILSREAADSLVTRLPDARLVTIPRSGHLVPLEQPELLAAAISYFLTPERQGAPDA
jgi:pimeloyl-ACP methyl ester carboxylesterase